MFLSIMSAAMKILNNMPSLFTYSGCIRSPVNHARFRSHWGVNHSVAYLITPKLTIRLKTLPLWPSSGRHWTEDPGIDGSNPSGGTSFFLRYILSAIWLRYFGLKYYTHQIYTPFYLNMIILNLTENQVVIEYISLENLKKITNDLLHNIIPNTEAETEMEKIVERKIITHTHHNISVRNQEMGDLMFIQCEEKNEVLIKLYTFELVRVEQLAQGNIEIETKLNQQKMNDRKKVGFI